MNTMKRKEKSLESTNDAEALSDSSITQRPTLGTDDVIPEFPPSKKSRRTVMNSNKEQIEKTIPINEWHTYFQTVCIRYVHPGQRS